VTDVSTLEQRMDDVRAVMDAVGSKRAALLGYSEGGPMCALFAATYPERVTALIMVGSYARRTKAPDYPAGADDSFIGAFLHSIEHEWGTAVGLDIRAPSMVDDPRFRQWWARFLRQSASPSAALALTRANTEIDIRHVLPSIRVPTLILHAGGDRTTSVENGRYLARNIPGAKLVVYDSDDHLPFCVGADTIVQNVQEFLTGVRPVTASDRVLGTILFTDIVDSTRLAIERGDQRWTDLLNAHHAAVRAELMRFRGREIGTAGDGFVAIFDGPARAIQCADAVRASVHDLGLRIRLGLHTGECEMRGQAVTGLALHIAARISALAPADGIVVSRTVKDLVAGSGIAFDDFGVHALKGVPDDWQLYRVAN
jgi:class 3 adenylate cyclase